jgi:RNA polymerase sigma factor (sigma-70 family)
MIDQKEKVFKQIIEANKEKIYRICRIYAVAPIEPQDLFQEVVFQVWKSLPSFKQASQIGTWIYKIALNVCYSSKLKLNRKNDLTDRMESIQFVPAEQPVNDDEKAKYQALRDCISALNDSEKTLVVLYLEELPYKDIAAVTGLTENHVAVKMKRIRKTLFDCITQKLN